MGSDYQEPFDGDRVPREIAWKDDTYGRIFTRMSNWRAWRRDYEEQHTWIDEKRTRGQRGWRRYQVMIRAIVERPLNELLGPPPLYHCKPLDAPHEGLFSMRYNQDIRLVFTFFNDELGKPLVKVKWFGFHYEGLQFR